MGTYPKTTKAQNGILRINCRFARLGSKTHLAP